jgi:hypothetical protein
MKKRYGEGGIKLSVKKHVKNSNSFFSDFVTSEKLLELVVLCYFYFLNG